MSTKSKVIFIVSCVIGIADIVLSLNNLRDHEREKSNAWKEGYSMGYTKGITDGKRLMEVENEIKNDKKEG